MGSTHFAPAERPQEEGELKEKETPTALQISPVVQGPLSFSVSISCFLPTVEGQKGSTSDREEHQQTAPRLLGEVMASQFHQPGKAWNGELIFFPVTGRGGPAKAGWDWGSLP